MSSDKKNDCFARLLGIEMEIFGHKGEGRKKLGFGAKGGDKAFIGIFIFIWGDENVRHGNKFIISYFGNLCHWGVPIFIFFQY